MTFVSEGATWSFGVNEEYFGVDYNLPGLRFVTILITPLEGGSIVVKIPGIRERSYRKPLKLKVVPSETKGTFKVILNRKFLTSTNCPLHQSGNMRVTVEGLHQVEYPSCRYEY
jgi:hypothetical protein